MTQETIDRISNKTIDRIDLCAYAQRQIGSEAERDRSFCMPLMFSFPKGAYRIEGEKK